MRSVSLARSPPANDEGIQEANELQTETLRSANELRVRLPSCNVTAERTSTVLNITAAADFPSAPLSPFSPLLFFPTFSYFLPSSLLLFQFHLSFFLWFLPVYLLCVSFLLPYFPSRRLFRPSILSFHLFPSFCFSPTVIFFPSTFLFLFLLFFHFFISSYFTFFNPFPSFFIPFFNSSETKLQM